MLPFSSFNPCFDGSVARGFVHIDVARSPWSFNPCFDGSVARGFCPARRAPYPLSFNPCFDGSVARGYFASCNRWLAFRFQSLF